MSPLLQDIHIIDIHTHTERAYRMVEVINVIFGEKEVSVNYLVSNLRFTVTFPKLGYVLTID